VVVGCAMGAQTTIISSEYEVIVAHRCGILSRQHVVAHCYLHRFAVLGDLCVGLRGCRFAAAPAY